MPDPPHARVSGHVWASQVTTSSTCHRDTCNLPHISCNEILSARLSFPSLNHLEYQATPPPTFQFQFRSSRYTRIIAPAISREVGHSDEQVVLCGQHDSAKSRCRYSLSCPGLELSGAARPSFSRKQGAGAARQWRGIEVKIERENETILSAAKRDWHELDRQFYF